MSLRGMGISFNVHFLRSYESPSDYYQPKDCASVYLHLILKTLRLKDSSHITEYTLFRPISLYLAIVILTHRWRFTKGN
jgi:hypothetical protein